MLSSIRNFSITLAVSLLIFGLLGYLVSDFAARSMGLVAEETSVETGNDTGSAQSSETSDPGAPPDTPAASRSGFTMLLVGTDFMSVFEDYDTSGLEGDGFPVKPRKVTADIMIILYANAKTGEISFCNLPSDLKVTDNGLTKTLGSLYGEYGISYLSEKVMDLIGIPVDYFMCVSVDGMQQVMTELGDITLYVPADMSYTDPVGGYDFTLTHGTRKLNAAEVMLYLRYNGYNDNGSQRRSNAMTLLKAILSNLTSDTSYKDNAKTLMNLYLTYVETNFTEQALNRYLDLIFMYPSLTQKDITYPGTYTVYEDERYFEPDVTGGRALFSQYKNA